MQYPQLFRQLREKKHLSLEALAARAGVHRNTVLNVESGRPVKFQTIATLMEEMGYAAQSPETGTMALLWLEAVSGINLVEPTSLNAARQKLATYTRSSHRAAAELAETVRRASLAEPDIRLLQTVAQRPELLSILRSICDLLPADAEADTPTLRVAEDKD